MRLQETCVCVKLLSCVQLFVTPQMQPTSVLCLWNSPGKNIGMGCHFLLQGIFLTQGLNLGLLHWQADSLQLSHLGSPLRMLRTEESQIQFSPDTPYFRIESISWEGQSGGTQTVVLRCCLWPGSNQHHLVLGRKAHPWAPLGPLESDSLGGAWHTECNKSSTCC